MMGIRLFSTSSISRYARNAPHPVDPDPKNFEILSTQNYSYCCVAVIKYPNCTTFKGSKVIVFKRWANELRNAIVIDPHFLENNDIIARFRPDDEGLHLAHKFAASYRPLTL